MIYEDRQIPYACSSRSSRHCCIRRISRFAQPNCSLIPCQAFYFDREPGRDFRSRADTSDPACSHLPWPKNVHKTGGFGSRVPSRLQVGAPKNIVYIFNIFSVKVSLFRCTTRTLCCNQAKPTLTSRTVFPLGTTRLALELEKIQRLSFPPEFPK